MYIKRHIQSTLEEDTKSILLLGPRQVGKSTMIKRLNPDLKINLSFESEFYNYSQNPSELEQVIKGKSPKTVLIDEVQRLPSLLNTIQGIIDDYENPPKFYLTGSSARKLKRGNANLLPGRIHSFFLGPLNIIELSDIQTNLDDFLMYGSLPEIFLNKSEKSKKRTLKTYAATYLSEEIQSESLTRNIEGFSRFLFCAANFSAEILDFSKLSSQSNVPRQSVKRYFEILEDTLIAIKLEAFSKSERVRLIQHPKYYFFDNGVLNGIVKNFNLGHERKGKLFESFIISQIFHCLKMSDMEGRLSYFRTHNNLEVDLILEFFEDNNWALELKASENIGRNDLKGLKKFESLFPGHAKPAVLYCGKNKKVIDGITIYPWNEWFLEVCSKIW